MKYEKMAIFLTFISLWLINFVSNEHQIGLSFLLILSVGLLHGSNDFSILSRFQKRKTLRNALLFLGGYILIVLLNAVLFYLIPSLALLVFVLLSGVHFGEQHLASKFKLSNPLVSYVLYGVYGLLIFFMLFITNSTETIKVINDITGIAIPQSVFIWGLVSTACITLVSFLFLSYKKKMLYDRLFFELFILAILVVIFNVANLVWGFAIYFIFWHSIPSIIEQLKFLYGTISWKSFYQYLKSAILIWFISLAAVLLLIGWANNNEDLVLALFFAFLGAITFAHSLLMSLMFFRKSE